MTFFESSDDKTGFVHLKLNLTAFRKFFLRCDNISQFDATYRISPHYFYKFDPIWWNIDLSVWWNTCYLIEWSVWPNILCVIDVISLVGHLKLLLCLGWHIFLKKMFFLRWYVLSYDYCPPKIFSELNITRQSELDITIQLNSA